MTEVTPPDPFLIAGTELGSRLIMGTGGMTSPESLARALDAYEGAMILVSHVPEFVRQIRIDETLDMK